MRSFFAALTIICAIIAGSIFYSSRMDRLSGDMLEKNNLIYSLIENDDFSGAAPEINKTSEYLENHSVMLWAMGDHSEIVQLERSLGELREFVKNEEKSDALAKCADLEVLIMHMPSNYKLRLENIL